VKLYFRKCCDSDIDKAYNWPGSWLISVQIPHVPLLVSFWEGAVFVKCRGDGIAFISPVTLHLLVSVDLLRKMVFGSWMCIIRNSYKKLCSRQL